MNIWLKLNLTVVNVMFDTFDKLWQEKPPRQSKLQCLWTHFQLNNSSWMLSYMSLCIIETPECSKITYCGLCVLEYGCGWCGEDQMKCKPSNSCPVRNLLILNQLLPIGIFLWIFYYLQSRNDVKKIDIRFYDYWFQLHY